MKHSLITIIAALTSISMVFARQPEKGYRGFADWSNCYRTAPGNTPSDPRRSVLYSGYSTSHGYQFNPVFFLGGGLDIEKCTSWNSTFFSFYAHGRADLKLGKFTPFGDLRLGYDIAKNGGIYISPSVGYRFNWGRKVGINIGLGLTLQGYKEQLYDAKYTIYEDITIVEITYLGERRDIGTLFSFRIGIDF